MRDHPIITPYGAALMAHGFVAQSDGPTTVAAAGSTILATYDVQGHERLSVEISVVTQALDGFAIQGRTHASAAYQTLYDTAAQFLSPVGLLIGTSGDLTSIAAGSAGWLLMETLGLESVQLTASAAVDSAAVTCRGTVS